MLIILDQAVQYHRTQWELLLHWRCKMVIEVHKTVTNVACWMLNQSNVDTDMILVFHWCVFFCSFSWVCRANKTKWCLGHFLNDGLLMLSSAIIRKYCVIAHPNSKTKSSVERVFTDRTDGQNSVCKDGINGPLQLPASYSFYGLTFHVKGFLVFFLFLIILFLYALWNEI